MAAEEHLDLRTAALRVLVVDDSRLIRELARLALEAGAGWHVSTAESGAEAVDSACADRPDVILLDVVMPDLDGPQTLARLREEPLTRAIPVIFATARDDPRELAELAQLGAEGLITKPFDIERLAGQVTEILAGRR